MIDLSPAQAAARITTVLDAPESRTLDFKRKCQGILPNRITAAGSKRVFEQISKRNEIACVQYLINQLYMNQWVSIKI